MKFRTYLNVGLASLAFVGLIASAQDKSASHHRKIHVSSVVPIDSSTSQRDCEQLHDDFQLDIFQVGSAEYRPALSFRVNGNHAIDQYRRISTLSAGSDRSVLVFAGESTLKISGKKVATTTTITAVLDHSSNVMQGVMSNRYCKAEFVSTGHVGPQG